MAQLTRPTLHDEIDVRFPDNTTEQITPPIVRAFLHNLVDSALLVVSDKIALSTALTLTQARALLMAAPPKVEPGQDYAITGPWNGISATPGTVYVAGLSNRAFHPEGVLLSGGKYLKVKVDVLAGTTASVSNSFADLLGVPADNAALAAVLDTLTDATSELKARLDAVLAGADSGLDTFLEALNRFLADETIAAVLNGQMSNLQIVQQQLTQQLAAKADLSLLNQYVGPAAIIRAGGAVEYYYSPAAGVAAMTNDALLVIRGSLANEFGGWCGGTIDMVGAAVGGGGASFLPFLGAQSAPLVVRGLSANGQLVVHRQSVEASVTIDDFRGGVSTDFVFYAPRSTAAGVKTTVTLNNYTQKKTGKIGNRAAVFNLFITDNGAETMHFHLSDCDITSTVGPIFGGTISRDCKIYLEGNTKLDGGQFGLGGFTSSATGLAIPLAEVLIDNRTPTQVTAAQLEAIRTTAKISALQLGDYTLSADDAGGVVPFSVGAICTIPTNVFALGTILEVTQESADAVTIAAAAGVTLRTATGLKTGGQWASVGLRQRALNEWVVTNAVL